MNRTTHYNLVLFESADKPTWLENWNQTMSHIDEVLYRISSGGGDLPDLSEVVARLEVLESQMSSANLQIQQNANNITAMQGSIETINTTLAGLADADTALESEISGINTAITSIQTSLGTITTQLNSFSTDLSNAITEIDSVVTRVSNCENRINQMSGSGSGIYVAVDYIYGLLNNNDELNLQDNNFNDGDIILLFCSNPITDYTINVTNTTFDSDISNESSMMNGNGVYSAPLNYIKKGSTNIYASKVYGLTSESEINIKNNGQICDVIVVCARKKEIKLIRDRALSYATYTVDATRELIGMTSSSTYMNQFPVLIKKSDNTTTNIKFYGFADTTYQYQSQSMLIPFSDSENIFETFNTENIYNCKPQTNYSVVVNNNSGTAYHYTKIT